MKYLLDTDIIVDHIRKKKFLTEDILRSGAAIVNNLVLFTGNLSHFKRVKVLELTAPPAR